jgi:hypothetical protein
MLPSLRLFALIRAVPRTQAGRDDRGRFAAEG